MVVKKLLKADSYDYVIESLVEQEANVKLEVTPQTLKCLRNPSCSVPMAQQQEEHTRQLGAAQRKRPAEHKAGP